MLNYRGFKYVALCSGIQQEFVANTSKRERNTTSLVQHIQQYAARIQQVYKYAGLCMVTVHGGIDLYYHPSRCKVCLSPNPSKHIAQNYPKGYSSCSTASHKCFGIIAHDMVYCHMLVCMKLDTMPSNHGSHKAKDIA